MRVALLLLAAVALTACNARAMQGANGESSADASVEAPLATATMLVRQRDYPDARQALESAVQPARLNQFSAARRREVIDLYALAALYGGDPERAHWAWRIATEDPQANADEWQGRLMSAAEVRDNADAYLAFDHLRQTAPDSIRAISPFVLMALSDAFALLPNAAAAHLQLAEVLFPQEETDPRTDFSSLWLQAAATSQQQGARDQAVKYARRITNPLVLVQLRADRRFDDVVATDPAAFDVNGLVQSQLAAARVAAAAQPDRITPQLQIATALYEQGHYPEALAALDAGLASGPTYGEDPSLPFALVARRATVLSELGRNAEALTVATTVCQVCGRKTAFNLLEAHLLIGMKRGAEALPLLEGDQAPDLDVAGRAEVVAMRACTYHQVGRTADAAGQLSLLKQNLRDNPDATLGALLCAGSDADVASALVAMLNDDQMRDVALGDLQTYHEGKLPPVTQALRARLSAIAARPEVKTVLDRVGRVAAYNMPRYAIVG